MPTNAIIDIGNERDSVMVSFSDAQQPDTRAGPIWAIPRHATPPMYGKHTGHS